MDIWPPKKRSEVMALVHSKDTKPEIKLRKALFALGYRYRIHDKNLPGRPDIVFPKYRTVIFVHGCFWHRHENCRAATTPKSNLEYWSPKFAANVARDSAHQKSLEAAGWNVIIIWECKLKTNLSSVISDIAEKLK
ncbi:very short patch repair endonuclease [Mucilaginibacter rubeus]|uniref:Very short patch repair endonuclease n=1 Tax=Mucilaginibacter rubeus TaxID=2027860 RepID=A0A5C1I4A7_9SPHI|nr:very short patch repair endonuclease [Mucilaginibacter rubeus]QEM12218.1 DNA mismatch endonuclease Vsr [Mucilaginibacter rubeus]